jgi:phosphatidylglycerophosphate synthase
MVLSALFLPHHIAGIIIGICVFLHYITDALDGALGRFRNEGYIMWGYYADHCFDAIYQVSAMSCFYFLLPASQTWLALLLIGTMMSVNYFFHNRELEMYQRGLATRYTNLVGTIPLHYIEWVAGSAPWITVYLGLPWWIAASIIEVALIGGLWALLIWHYRRGIHITFPRNAEKIQSKKDAKRKKQQAQIQPSEQQ